MEHFQYVTSIRHSRGDDGHNLVTIVMKEHSTDLNGALDWISNLHDDLVKEFLNAFKCLPSSLDAQVATYVDGLGNWVRAGDCWSFEVCAQLSGRDTNLIYLVILAERKVFWKARSGDTRHSSCQLTSKSVQSAEQRREYGFSGHKERAWGGGRGRPVHRSFGLITY